MSDIDKCSGIDCPLSKTCYRFTASISEFWQWWGKFEYNKQTKTCDFYWEVETKKTKK